MTSQTAAAKSTLDELDDFFLDGDLDDNPFASPKGHKNDSSNKRKEPGDGLGIDEEVSIAKKARVPRIKLDQDRLMSQKGIPALRRRAKDLKLKGKGHEWSDATRLLSFYQEWLDDLFPKAKFLDALAMVEKAGHNKMMHTQRVEWINEGRPKTSVIEGGADQESAEVMGERTEAAPKQASRIAPIFNTVANDSRPKTPDADDLFNDDNDDIYNATPIDVRKNRLTREAEGEPHEDEIDALMAESESLMRGPAAARPTRDVIGSIFGNGTPNHRAQAQNGDDDDLDALIAEAEAVQAPRQTKNSFEPSKAASSSVRGPVSNGGVDMEDDELDALIAEAEAQAVSTHGHPVVSKTADLSAETNAPNFDDEEEAMAEMDGLW